MLFSKILPESLYKVAYPPLIDVQRGIQILGKDVQKSLQYAAVAIALKLVCDIGMRYFSSEKQNEKKYHYGLVGLSYLSIGIALAFITRSWCAASAMKNGFSMTSLKGPWQYSYHTG